MLRLDLARLAREGSIQVEAVIPADDPLWDGLEVALDAPVAVRLTAATSGTGEIVVRGHMEATYRIDCRRCLEPVPGKVSEELTMVFVPSDSEGAEDDGDVRVVDAVASELDLSDPVREELVLAMDLFVVCDPDCPGLCPQCGVNLKTETCACTTAESDPRWDALRALKEE